MSVYIVSRKYHPDDWLCFDEEEKFYYWGSYRNKEKFNNMFSAEMALKSIEIETDSYNDPLKHYIMKVKS